MKFDASACECDALKMRKATNIKEKINIQHSERGETPTNNGKALCYSLSTVYHFET